MKLLQSKQGLKFVMIYILLLIVATAFAFFMITYNPSKSEFVGVYMLILTLPWGIFLTLILDYFNMIDSISVSIKIVLLLICSIPNAFILYFIGSNIEKKKFK